MYGHEPWTTCLQLLAATNSSISSMFVPSSVSLTPSDRHYTGGRLKREIVAACWCRITIDKARLCQNFFFLQKSTYNYNYNDKLFLTVQFSKRKNFFFFSYFFVAIYLVKGPLYLSSGTLLQPSITPIILFL